MTGTPAAPTVRPSFWLRLGLRTVLPVVNLLLAVVAFPVVLVLLVLSVGLVPLFLVGLPVFVVTGIVARWMTRVDRRRARLFHGVDLPGAGPAPTGVRATLRHAATWRAIGYLILVKLPLAVATFALTVGAWGTGLALISMPGWLHHIPSREANVGFGHVTTTGTAWLLCPVGVVLVGLGFVLAWGFGALDVVVVRGLLSGGHAELSRRVETLQQSRARVLDSAEAERRRIERDLHDGAQQRLVALAMNLGRARGRFDSDPAGARELLDEAQSDAKQALAELRDLARGLHPAVLTDRGLDAALSGLAARCPVPVVLDVDLAADAEGRACSPTIEAIAYFVVSEALTNAAKHARAHRVEVSVRCDGPRLLLRVCDDGAGGAEMQPGGGLAGLADRVAGVDGVLRLDSPTGGPTELVVELPCES